MIRTNKREDRPFRNDMEENFKMALSEYFNEVDKEKDQLLEELKQMQSQLVRHGKLEKKDVETNQKKEKLIKKLTSNGKVLVKEIERLKEELQKCQKQVNGLDDENKKLKYEIDYERGQIPHLQLEVKKLVDENSYLKTLAEDTRKLKDQEHEIHELEHQIAFQQNLCNEYSLEIKDKDKQIKNLQASIATLQEQVIKINQLKEEREQLDLVVQERDEFKCDYEKMHRVADGLEKRLVEIVNQKELFKEKLDAEKRSNEDRLDELQQLHRTVKTLEQARETDGKDLENQQDAIRQLHNENIILGRQIEALKKDLNVSKMTMDTLKYEDELLKEELKVTQRKIAEMEDMNKRWQARERELLEEMAEAKTKIAYLNNSTQASEERARCSQDELERTIEKLTQVQMAFDRKGNRENELQREILAYVKKCSKLEQDLLFMNKKAVKLRDELQDSETQRGTKQVECLKLQEKLSAKESALESEKERFHQIEQQLEGIKKRTITLETEIDEREREKRCLRNELDMNENKFEHLEHQIERSKSDTTHLRQELKNSAMIIDDLNEKLRNCFRERKDVEMKYENVQSDMKCKEDSIDSLRKDLEDKVKEFKLLKSELCKKDEELDDKSKLCLKITKQLEISKQDILRLENEAAELRSCMDEKSEEVMTGRRANEQLQDDLDIAKRKYLKLESTYRAVLEQNENLEREILENRKKIMEATLWRNEMEGHDIEMRKEMDTSKKRAIILEKRCEDMEHSIRENNLMLDNERKQLQALGDEKRSLLKEIDQLKIRMHEKEQQLSLCEMKNQTLCSVEEDRLRFLKESELLKVQVMELQERINVSDKKSESKDHECKNLKKALSDCQRELASMKDGNERVLSEKRSVERHIQALNEKLEIVEEKALKGSQENKRLQHYIDSEFRHHGEMKEEVVRLREAEKLLREDCDVAKAKIIDLEALNNDTMKESGKVTIELFAAHERIKQSETMLTSLKTEKDKLSEIVTSSKKELNENSMSVQHLKKENKELRGQLIKLEQHQDQLSDELSVKASQAESLQNELSTNKLDYQDKLNQFLSDKKIMLDDFNELKKKCMALEMERDQQQRSMDELDLQLSQSEQDMKLLEEELHRTRTTQAKLEGRTEEALKREQEKEANARELAIRLDELEKCKTEIMKEKEILAMENDQLKSRQAVLLGRVNDLTSQHMKMKANEENRLSFKSKLEQEKHVILEELKKTRSELEYCQETKSQLSIELEQVKEKLSHLEIEMSKNSKKASLESEQRYREEVEGLCFKLKQQEEELEKLREELKASTFQNQDIHILLDNERASRNAERESLLAEISCLKRSNCEMNSAREEIEMENRLLKRKLAEYENRIHSLEESQLNNGGDHLLLEHKSHDFTKYADEVKILQKQLKLLDESKRDELERMRRTLSSVQANKEQEISLLKSKLLDLDHKGLETEKIRVESENRADEINLLKRKNKDLEEEIGNLKKAGQGVTPEVEVLRGKLEWYEINKREAENERRRLIEELEDQSFELSQLQSKIDSSLVEKENHKKEIDNLKKEVTRITKEKERVVELKASEEKLALGDRAEIESLKRDKERLHDKFDSEIQQEKRKYEEKFAEMNEMKQELQKLQSLLSQYEKAEREKSSSRGSLDDLESKHSVVIERMRKENEELSDTIRNLQNEVEQFKKEKTVRSQLSPRQRSTLYHQPEKDNETNFDVVTLTIKPSEIKKSQAILVKKSSENTQTPREEKTKRPSNLGLSKNRPLQRSAEDLLNTKETKEPLHDLKTRPSSTDARISLSNNPFMTGDRDHQKPFQSLDFSALRQQERSASPSRDDETSLLGQTPSEIRASFESLLSLGSIGSDDTLGEQSSRRGGKFVNRLVADFEGRQKKTSTKQGKGVKQKVDLFS